MAIKFAKEFAEYKNLSQEEKAATKEPLLHQIVTTDTTIEALKTILDDNPDGIIFTADEASGWVRSLGQYKGGAGDDRQIWLSIWSSTQIVTNRKSSRFPLIIDDPFVCITGGLQPDVLGDFIGDREDGLAARFLFSYPDALPPSDWNDNTVKHCTPTGISVDQLYELAPFTAAETLVRG